MKKLVFALAAIGLVLGGTRFAAAQAPAPALVVSISGVNEIWGDVDFVSKVAEQPALSQLVQFSMAPFVEGVDRTKPVGLTVGFGADGSPVALAFVPVSDFDKLLATVGQFLGEPEDAGDDVVQLTVPVGLAPVPVFVKEANGFAFVAQDPKQLANVPEDPIKSLQGLHTKYDLAVRVNVQNIPKPLRDQGLDFLKQSMEQIDEVRVEGDEEVAELQAAMRRRQFEQLEQASNEADSLTIGWAIDAKAKNVFFEVEMTALPDTELATQMAALKEATSRFGALLRDEAMVRMVIAVVVPEKEIAETLSMLQHFRRQVNLEIDDSKDFPDDKARAAAKSTVGELIDVAAATIKAGKLDMGFGIVGDGPFTILVAAQVADGKKLNTALVKLLKLFEEDAKANETEIQIDAARHEGVTFHVVTPPAPAEDEAKFVGEDANIVFGTGTDVFYLALGSNTIATLSKFIDAAAASEPVQVKPVEMTVALKPILTLAGEESPQAAAAAEALQPGADRIRFTLNPVPNGGAYRVEVDEGVLKAIGRAVGSALPGGVIEEEEAVEELQLDEAEEAELEVR